MFTKFCKCAVVLKFRSLQKSQRQFDFSPKHYFSLKADNLTINWLLLSYATCRIERLSSPFDKNMKTRGLQKSQFSNILVNWEKIGSEA